MEKRKYEFDDGPDEKRPRYEDSWDEFATDEAEFFMEQRLVGWVIGRGGATLKEIEQAHHVKIAMDQGSKDLGYSKVKIIGSRENWQAAADHINQSLSRAATNTDGTSAVGPFLLDRPPEASPADTIHEEIHIDQRHVGWLVGKGGAGVRDIEQSSGCKISINQDSRTLGYSRAVLHGGFTERQEARRMIEESLDRAKANDGQMHDAKPLDGELQIEQHVVGWLIGKGGGVMKELEQETGVRISIDQSTKDRGYSTVKINGDPSSVEVAKERIQSQLQKVRSADDSAEGVQIDQHCVGWLLGKSGSVMKDIEHESGARVSIDQSTKDQGYSTVWVSGARQSVAIAKQRVLEKVAQVNPPAPTHSSASSNYRATPLHHPVQAPAVSSSNHLPRTQAPPPIPLETQAACDNLLRQLGQGSRGEDRIFTVRQIAKTLLAALEPRPDPSGGWNPSVRSSSSPNQPTRGNADLPKGRLVLPPLRAPKLAAATAPPAPLPGRATAEEETLELQVDQQLVGWLMGKNGSTMKEIQTESGARVVIDQGTQQLGYSTVRMSGSASAVLRAQKRIQASLAGVGQKSDKPSLGLGWGASLSGVEARHGSPRDDMHGRDVEEMQVEQRVVGWLVGGRGAVIKEIEQQSGARISIDQSTKEQGFSTVRIKGSTSCLSAARQLINDKISHAR